MTQQPHGQIQENYFYWEAMTEPEGFDPAPGIEANPASELDELLREVIAEIVSPARHN